MYVIKWPKILGIRARSLVSGVPKISALIGVDKDTPLSCPSHFSNIGERITAFGFVVGNVQVNAVTIPFRIFLMFWGTWKKFDAYFWK